MTDPYTREDDLRYQRFCSIPTQELTREQRNEFAHLKNKHERFVKRGLRILRTRTRKHSSHYPLEESLSAGHIHSQKPVRSDRGSHLGSPLGIFTALWKSFRHFCEQQKSSKVTSDRKNR